MIADLVDAGVAMSELPTANEERKFDDAGGKNHSKSFKKTAGC